jgi:TPR repeat protein
MKKLTLGVIMLFTSPIAMSGNDVWQTLFNEKLQEALQGNSNAQFDIGSMYQNGRGVSPDRREAIEWYKKAAAQNNELAVSRLQLLQANEERFRKVLASAAKGDKESQYKLGNMYTEGIGTDIDLAKAAKAYEQSANQGYAKAEYKLGLVYYEGIGVDPDKKKAYNWFIKAADKGHAAAQYYLGKMYASGEGVKRDEALSLAWYTKAVDGGFTQARSEMVEITEKTKAPNKTNPAPDNKATTSKSTATVKAKKRRPETKVYGIEDLMAAAWSRDGEPVPYLPSAINNCRTENDKIACYSDNQTRETPGSTVRFKTKSIMRNFSRNGSFDVTYRNLVIDSTNATRHKGVKEANEIGSVVTDIGAYTVKTGWGKEHLLECRMIAASKVSCLKDKTHTFTLISPHTVASGR